MKHFIASLLIGLLTGNANATLSPTRVIDANKTNGVFTFRNLVNNDGFEKGSRGWTASGGTFTVTTNAADVGDGSRAGSWDSNAASQTLTSTAVAIPAGDYGANYEVSANLKCASGTCTHLIQAFDGTNVIASQAITSSLTYARTTLNFVAPTSGNISARIVSVAADEPNLFVDDVYLGRARNVGSVAQAELVGTVKIAGCAGGFSGTSATYANFGTQSGCSYSLEGSVNQPSTNIPAVRLINQRPGRYVFSYTGNAAQTTGNSECFFRLSDGTNNSLEENAPFSSASLAVNYLDFSIVYNNPISDSTLQIQYKRPSGSANCQVYGTSANPGVIKIYRYPLSSEIAYRPEQMQNFGSVIYSDATYRSSNTVATTTETDLTITSLQSYASYSGKAQACNTNTQLCLRAPQLPAGTYRVDVRGYLGYNSPATSCVFAINDGITSEQNLMTSDESSSSWSTSPLYATFTYTSTGSREFRITARRISGTGNCVAGFQDGANSTTNAPSLRITLFPISQSLPAPNLVGSVTSLSAGSLRIESAEFGDAGGGVCTASPCTILRPTSSWISTVTRSGTGDYSMTINSWVFASQPQCFISSGATIGVSVSAVPVSATVFNVAGRISSTGAAIDLRSPIMCIGPRGSL